MHRVQNLLGELVSIAALLLLAGGSCSETEPTPAASGSAGVGGVVELMAGRSARFAGGTEVTGGVVTVGGGGGKGNMAGGVTGGGEPATGGVPPLAGRGGAGLVGGTGTSGVSGASGSAGATELTCFVEPGSGGAAGAPSAGLGELSGACGAIEPADFQSPDPSYHELTIDFGTVGYEESDISAAGTRVRDTPNEGGQSTCSEMLAYEVLRRCEMACLLATESEIKYAATNPSAKTDILVEIEGTRVGVSVVRAFQYPVDQADYAVESAKEKMAEKLADIGDSTSEVVAAQRWPKQILAVITPNEQSAESVRTAYSDLTAQEKGDTIVLVVLSHGDDAWIYENTCVD